MPIKIWRFYFLLIYKRHSLSACTETLQGAAAIGSPAKTTEVMLYGRLASKHLHCLISLQNQIILQVKKHILKIYPELTSQDLPHPLVG